MPRAGLTASDVTLAAAALADEEGQASLTMGSLATRLGIRTPSLYKHVDSLADLRHRVAALAMTELGDQITAAIAGRSGRDALAASLAAVREYVTAHPGRYATTTGATFDGPDDPLMIASDRVITAIAAVLRGYDVPDSEMTHAIRTIRATVHGFAMLEAADGFQWPGDPEDTFEWMVAFIDRGLCADRALS